jgi:hypothetical protein
MVPPPEVAEKLSLKLSVLFVTFLYCLGPNTVVSTAKEVLANKPESKHSVIISIFLIIPPSNGKSSDFRRKEFLVVFRQKQKCVLCGHYCTILGVIFITDQIFMRLCATKPFQSLTSNLS